MASMMKMRILSLLVLAATALACMPSCSSSDEPKRKKVVGPDSSEYSNLPWNRPKPWEGNARYGAFMPGSR